MGILPMEKNTISFSRYIRIRSTFFIYLPDGDKIQREYIVYHEH